MGLFNKKKTEEPQEKPVKHPGQIAFEKNLKFLNKEAYPAEFFQSLFIKNAKTEVFEAGTTDFPTGEVVLADPLAYLGSKYQTVLEKKIPAGSYPVELSICRSGIVGLRIAGARLRISEKPTISYEIAMPKGSFREDLGKPGVWTFFGVDTGLACFADIRTAEENRIFFEKWQKENPEKNKYKDYFAELFLQSYAAYPQLQNQGGSFLHWEMPETGHEMVLFASGMGDGVYSGYWGLNAEGEITCLVVPFMNPEFF